MSKDGGSSTTAAEILVFGVAIVMWALVVAVSVMDFDVLFPEYPPILSSEEASQAVQTVVASGSLTRRMEAVDK